MQFKTLQMRDETPAWWKEGGTVTQNLKCNISVTCTSEKRSLLCDYHMIGIMKNRIQQKLKSKDLFCKIQDSRQKFKPRLTLLKDEPMNVIINQDETKKCKWYIEDLYIRYARMVDSFREVPFEEEPANHLPHNISTIFFPEPRNYKDLIKQGRICANCCTCCNSKNL